MTLMSTADKAAVSPKFREVSERKDFSILRPRDFKCRVSTNSTIRADEKNIFADRGLEIKMHY